jgi:hypothetical protein
MDRCVKAAPDSMAAALALQKYILTILRIYHNILQLGGIMKPFESGERVTWKIQDHGKEKKIIGLYQSSENGVASVKVGDEIKTTLLARLNRCRGRKPNPMPV